MKVVIFVKQNVKIDLSFGNKWQQMATNGNKMANQIREERINFQQITNKNKPKETNDDKKYLYRNDGMMQ